MTGQVSLFGEKVEKVDDLIMEIEFTIKKTNSLSWNGKGHPHVTSGCAFGGAIDYEGKEQIDKIISKQKEWFEHSYGRPVKTKIKIIDERKTEILGGTNGE